LPSENFLGFTNVLEKDKSNFYHLTFLIENKKFEHFESLKFVFTNYKNKSRSIEISNKEINNDVILFDDSIWE
jgi:hypothetical protein